MYSIKEITKLTGLPLSTLRYYEGLNLLGDVPRNESGIRYYTEENKKRLDSIACFKNMGMKIGTLSLFFEYESNVTLYHKEILSLLSKQKNIIEEQLLLQQENLKHVDQKIAYFTAVDSAINHNKEIPDWNNGEW